jgi:REP element-mobilizing transposase RayT
MSHQLFYHILWTTRDRRSRIDRHVAAFLDQTLRTIAAQERARVLALGLVTTHVHLLVRVHPMTSVPRLLQRLKGVSSALAGRTLRLAPGRQLQWAPGYTIHTVSPSVVAKLADYVRNQAVRHPREAIKGWKGSVGDPREERSPPGQFEDELGCLEKVKRLRPR